MIYAVFTLGLDYDPNDNPIKFGPGSHQLIITLRDYNWIIIISNNRKGVF